jgi:glycosyltransferase involved in cell wall biosynthesis
MKVAVLAEQNFNLIDGSTIWLLNVCKLLALQNDFEVELLLTHPLETLVLAGELPGNIRIRDANILLETAGIGDTRLRTATILPMLRTWEDTMGAYDRIFIRGTEYLTELMGDAGFKGRIVGYAPGALPNIAQPEPEWVRLGRAAAVPIVLQSKTAKRALESLLDYPANLVHVVPPIVFPVTLTPRDPDQPATLCYSGKVDLHYGLDWLIDICSAVAGRDDLAVSLIAGKDTYRARYPDFFKSMDAFRARIAAGDATGISLMSNVSHAQAKGLMGQADFAYCMRHDRYDDVIEISTKIVEFCTLGVAPILNDNALNRELFGDDYPYLIDIATDDIQARLIAIMESRHAPDQTDYTAARARIADIARRFSAPALADRLGRAIRGFDRDAPALTDSRRSILIPTHERKFLRQFIDRVRADSAVEVTWESWESTVKPAQPPKVPEGIDTVFCEWCCQNAVWHSNNKRLGSKLIVRLHRFEAFREFPTLVNWDNVDALIVVSDYFRDHMIKLHSLDPARIHVIPQYIDWSALQRPKLPEARFTIGLVGINPFEHKRFDRALDMFEVLRASDSRFQLAVRSVMPWDIGWVWDRDDDTRAQFESQFDRIFSNPDLDANIRFDVAGPDMEEWYRGIGTILSSSDSEGCHTAVMEGMASGSLPVVNDWPGATSLFAPHVYADMTDAIANIITFAERPDIDEARAAIAATVEQYDIERFTQTFFTL